MGSKVLFAEALSKSFRDPVKRCLISVLAPASLGSGWCFRGRDGPQQRNPHLEPAQKALGNGRKEERPGTREDGAGTKP